MNILRSFAGASALLATVMASTASASTLSLSGPASVNPGDTFQLIIEGDFSAAGLTAGGGLFGYNPALVTLNSIAFGADVTTDASFSCPSGSNAACASTANSESVWWATFSGNVLNPGHAAPAQMMVIDLTANMGASGTAAFTLVDDPAAGGWFDAVFADATPTFSGTSVTIAAVPVPAAAWLFGSGLLGMVGVARRRRAA